MQAPKLLWGRPSPSYCIQNKKLVKLIPSREIYRLTGQAYLGLTLCLNKLWNIYIKVSKQKRNDWQKSYWNRVPTRVACWCSGFLACGRVINQVGEDIWIVFIRSDCILRSFPVPLEQKLLNSLTVRVFELHQTSVKVVAIYITGY